MNKINLSSMFLRVVTLTLSLGSAIAEIALHALTPIPTSERVTLTNPALRLIDGVPFGIDAKAIQNILTIRKKVREMQYGVLDKKRNQYVGLYTLGDKRHCIKSLVMLEKEYDDEFTRKKESLHKKYLNTATYRHAWALLEEKLEEELEEKLIQQEAISLRRHSNDEQRLLEAKKLKRKIKREYALKLEEEQEMLQRKHMSDNTLYEKELQALTRDYHSKITPLQTLLKDVKKELMHVTEPFLEQARSAKEFLLPLMEEWAEKSERQFSPLLRWHEEDGSELEIFERDVKSFARVDTFCTDLVDFNESIVYNCPRGYKQFMELLAHHK